MRDGRGPGAAGASPVGDLTMVLVSVCGCRSHVQDPRSSGGLPDVRRAPHGGGNGRFAPVRELNLASSDFYGSFANDPE
jgi:hypothetical protein